MHVRIIGNGHRWKIVTAADSRLCGWGGTYSECLLIAGQNSWTVVR